ncbi:UPF0721 transmembrane protein [Luteitalea sp. TBR-22]|uniref:sulfite exporter TauE/SafE family protein n=1 Tax=Luteitalea sp. TBR-22 TaxID=2802971 RepID=UPI001AFC3017|nr:sulfite exporter TauE/SafE family protein [Luteitalea sp. TBR-22]BCS35052.1 UPF0721 transmembrane protein [Luteitalea sp. TBR-22]
MTLEPALLLLVGGSVLAGALGSLTGLGGGVLLVPMLTLGFGVDIRYAAGASLVSVIATSSGAAATYVKEGYSNIRVAMVLELATTTGAMAGATLALLLAPSLVATLFGVVPLLSALPFDPAPATIVDGPSDKLSRLLRLDGSYPSAAGSVHYRVRRIPAGFLVMAIAGALSGLLGIGSGALKVLALDRLMGLPFKVSTTTSNFMIGVTAAASAGVYLRRGYIDPFIAAPVLVGVLAGAWAGAQILTKARPARLRSVFRVVLVLLGLQMILGAAGVIP